VAKGMALITGASSGLILVARREDRLRQLARTLGERHGVAVRTIALDLAESGASEEIHRQTAGDTVEILINNAGFGLRGRYDQTDWNAESRLMDVNMIALAHLTKLFVQDMVGRGSGRILNVGSTAAFVPGPLMAMYYASKAFVVSFSLALAKEFEGTGVSITVLCPGPTTTEFIAAAGIADSKLFRGSAMTAREVAEIGYRAMLAGRPEVIAGARNRWMILLSRLAPRTMLASIAKRLNSSA